MCICMHEEKNLLFNFVEMPTETIVDNEWVIMIGCAL